MERANTLTLAADFGGSPTPQVTANPADAQLEHLAERFGAALREDLVLDRSDFPPIALVAARQEALGAELEAMRDQARQLRATMPAGLRAKALLLAETLSPPESTDYDNPEQRLARSLVADILAWPAIDMTYLQHAVFWHAEGYWPSADDAAADAEFEGYVALLRAKVGSGDSGTALVAAE